MNVDDEYNVAARYRTIRKHLDSLGYRQALSLDALPLIEKLLADLIQTTDSLKHFKTVAHNNVEVRCFNFFFKALCIHLCCIKAQSFLGIGKRSIVCYLWTIVHSFGFIADSTCVYGFYFVYYILSMKM